MLAYELVDRLPEGKTEELNVLRREITPRNKLLTPREWSEVAARSNLLVVIDGARYVGMGVMSVSILPDPRSARISDVVLIPEYQRHGHGADIIRKLMSVAAREGVSVIEFQQEIASPATRKLARTFGFRLNCKPTYSLSL